MQRVLRRLYRLIDLVLCVQKVDDDGTRHAGLYECILDRNYAPLFSCMYLVWYTHSGSTTTTTSLQSEEGENQCILWIRFQTNLQTQSRIFIF